jgi:DNA polymerase (family X)
MKLASAQHLTARIRCELAPFCDRIDGAGSVRRLRADCGDIDLVITPKINSLADIKERCLRNGVVVQDGSQNFIMRLNAWGAQPQGFQIDIFFAQPDTSDMFEQHPTNHGSLLLCRTGSKEFNIFLIEHAKKIGLTWNPYKGVFNGDGRLIASRTEEEIFVALRLDYVPPEKRERR